MKKDLYTFDKSSFLIVEKNLSLIVNKLLKDESFKKLLYYTTSDALKRSNLTQEETLELIDKGYIKSIPKITEDETLKNYLIINFGSFSPCLNNSKYKNCVLTFTVLCNFDQWNLGDYKLRPYKIAGRIDSLFNNIKLDNIGKVQFLTGDELILNENVGGVTLLYSIIYNGEDNYYPLDGVE